MLIVFIIDSTGLPVPIRDAAVWEYGRINGCIIVTNDEDFLNLAQVKGYPPKVVLLRTGNQRTDFLLSVLVRHKHQIEALHTSKEIGLLEIFS